VMNADGRSNFSANKWNRDAQTRERGGPGIFLESSCSYSKTVID
jgi:hypothetical protein